MKTLKELKAKDLKGKKVLVRVDFNVPVEKGEVVDAFRIEKSLPTLTYLRDRGAKLLLVSHIGEDGKGSLLPAAKCLAGSFPVIFTKEISEAQTLLEAKEGVVVMLENIRRFEGEKKNDKKLAKELSSLADFYVNEAFSVSHRAHASVVGIPKFLPSYAGLQFEKEVKHLEKLLNPKKPLLVVLGGAKFSTKVPLVKRFLKSAEKIVIGGAIANSFFKFAGYEIGKSVVEEDVSYLKTLARNPKIVLPTDLVVKGNRGLAIKKPNEIAKNESIVDVGPETFKAIGQLALSSKTVLWNGPLGWFEKGHRGATDSLAKVLAGSKAYSVVGGGDTLASLKDLGVEEKIAFVSTGGGAMLDFLATGTLPGLKALGK